MRQQNFHVKYVITLQRKIIKLLNVIIVDYGFISDAIKLTLKLTNIFKKKSMHGIVFLAQAKYFLFQT